MLEFGSGDVVVMDGSLTEPVKEVTPTQTSEAQLEDIERKARVDAVWEQMNKGISVKTFKSFSSKPSSSAKKTPQKTSSSWMTVLGLAPNKTRSPGKDVPPGKSTITENGSTDEAKRIAAAALTAVKEAAAAASGKGKVEITELKDFAGQDIEVKKLVDADSKEAFEMANASMGPPSAVDAILEQIKKKQKLSVLDKTKKDWGEYKGDNKGVEEELDAYKKSSNQYLDKVSFLERADYREFERERDARLALQARRKSDMRED